MLKELERDQDNTVRELTIDELESVCGGAGTTFPPSDGCGGANCHKCGCGCP
jgi:hypothetical protein